ncbi:MAG TPA: hypothetical protein PLY87_12370 [Planctomycetaceae bacterium]|nr:hypothetical protein [Planctomycetaceae bacterium]
MPIHLTALDRRRFLQAVGASILVCGRHATASETAGVETDRLSPEGVTLTTHTTDKLHEWNGETKTLTWRSA